ncbi:MAG: hypothetical protein IPL10_07885 [Bacteroidetes bacterium]|nr:hypothetical protein [Bacteroidota bacterium]
MQEIYTTIISTFIINNNCVEISLNEDASFDLSSVKKHFEEVYDIIKTPYSKTLIDFSNVSFLSVPKESMQYMANNEYTNNNSSLAIIINGLPQKLIGNFYLNVMKPKRKTKFFTSKKMAISWLNTIDETTSA